MSACLLIKERIYFLLSQVGFREATVFINIYEALSKIVDDKMDLFWITRAFCKQLDACHVHFPVLVTYTGKLLLRQDPELHKYVLFSF